LAGLEWSCVDLEKGEIHIKKQFTHEAWADLKTVNSRRRVPLAKELLKQLTLHRTRIPGSLFSQTVRSAAALPQLALPRVDATLEAIGRIRIFSHAAAFFS